MILIIEATTGTISLVLLVIASYYSFQVLKSFEENEELAATKIFLHHSIVNSLKVHVIGSLIFGVSGLFSVYAIATEMPEIFQNMYKIGAAYVFATYTYMMYNIAQSTRQTN